MLSLFSIFDFSRTFIYMFMNKKKMQREQNYLANKIYLKNFLNKLHFFANIFLI
jgi:hypothetical protein